MLKRIREHPFFALVVSVPVVVGGAIGLFAAVVTIWSGFTHCTIPEFLAEKGWKA